MEHWRGLLRGLADALHSLLFVRGSWPALKATLIDFASRNNHAIVRSAVHLQLIKPLPPAPAPVGGSAAPNGSGGSGSKAAGGGKKAAAEMPAWCPGQQMVCREFGLSAAAVPSPDAVLFIEQACIAVGSLCTFGWEALLACGLHLNACPVTAWFRYLFSGSCLHTVPAQPVCFLTYLQPQVQGQVYALCLNRCRQRRRLRRQLEDWKNIFDHGFNAGQLIQLNGG